MAEHRPPGPRSGGPPVVGIGASAGGLEALKTFFQSIPDDLSAAYVVIVHLAPDHESDLPGILARETRMPVIQVGDHEQVRLKPDEIYVIAPDRKLEITDSSVGASRFEQPHGKRNAIDLFLRSLAAAGGEIFAVILSGGGSDGVQGARAVREAGGLVLVQEPNEAAHDSMPRAVLADGAADVVLPVRELAARIAELVRSGESASRLLRDADKPRIEDDDAAALQQVLEMLRRRTGHDFSRYKRATVLRRLGRRMQLSHTQRISDYLGYLEENVEEIQSLFNDMLITVTTFFRDPAAWAALQKQVIGPLVERTDPDEPIRCWVPGCATGEEAYTLAILFGEEIERRKTRREWNLFASDVDDRALSVAREGLYPDSISNDVSPQRLKRWFRRTDGYYRISPELRDRLVFATHSLQRDPPFSRLHLVSCRNLLIYLEHELQDQVMAIFRYACRDDGYLFLGTSESASPKFFRPLDKEQHIYQAGDNGSARRPALSYLSTGLPQVSPRREPGRPKQDSDTLGEAHRAALEDHAPPSILVDESWDALYLSESAGRFLQPRGGPATHAVTELVRAELRGELTAALRHAFETHEQWLSEFVAVQFNGTPRQVGILVQPRPGEDKGPVRALVLFLEAGPAPEEWRGEGALQPGSERERGLLEKLRQSERQIKQLRDEHHTAEEDLRAANEELQSLNEEYRSTTEELETSKEELQSINEELQTVNVELKGKLEEISGAHDDLENLMAATDVATLFLDRNLCIKRFTPQLIGLFKVKSHDLGRPIGDITHTLDYDHLDQDARRVLADLAPIERDTATDDGRVWIVRLRPYRTADDRIDGVVITLIDVTKLKHAEQVLRESEARFRALVDASAQIVWTTDAKGVVVEDSPSWRAFTGQTIQQWQGGEWAQAVHPQDRATAEQRLRDAVENREPLSHEFRLYHAPSQRYRWTSVRAVPLWDPGGAVRGWVGMNTDITERKEAEDALRESDRLKDEFLAMLGHELRNPLAAIRSSVEFATLSEKGRATGPADDAFLRAFAIVDRQSRHMARLVNDLLDVTRITRNKLELRRQPTDIARCMEDVVGALRTRLDAGGLRLELRAPERPVFVDADPERLVQILDNLLRNAISYTDAGGTIAFAARREGESAAVTVRDTGIGFAPEQGEALFEPYRQADHGRGKEGLGLGLALVKRLVALHGGTITARSEGLGSGSEFELIMPLARSGATPRRDVPPRGRPPRRRVLVVDDETDVADMFADLLKELGQDVETAYSGEAALQTASQQRPRIAFLDLSMPDMSGSELTRRLRERFPPEQLVLVAVSGHASRPPDTGKGLFQHHLLKPADTETLIELLSSLDVPEAGPGETAPG